MSKRLNYERRGRLSRAAQNADTLSTGGHNSLTTKEYRQGMAALADLTRILESRGRRRKP